MGKRKPSSHWVQFKTGFQPGVYLLRVSGLRQGGMPHGRRRAERVQDGVWHCPGLFKSKERGRTQSGIAVGGSCGFGGGRNQVQMAETKEKQRILILEDDEDLAQGICLSLSGDGLEFFCCRTVKEAEEVFAKGAFDLLILDINLPDGSGLSFCREVRKISRIPIALLTAKDMEMDIVAGLECGADDYITKPFSLMVLRARIRALLRRGIPEKKSEYRDGTFYFSFDTMNFYKNGEEISLSKTEQRILYLLVMHPGQILTREQLLEWAWPEGTEYVEDNALSVGIRRLRDKLEDVPGEPKYIRTLYGKGYVWD